MNYTLIFNPIIISVIAGSVLGAGLLYLLVKYIILWLIGDKQTTPAQPQAVQTTPHRTLAGLSWVIATTHRSASQLIGLVMSSASLIAIILSVLCAVAGITIISYQKFGSLLFSGVAALSTLILSTLIESISINALKNIRLSNEAIAQAEKAHNAQMMKKMEEQFEEDAKQFAQVNHQTLTKEEMESMKRAANLKSQARKEFEKKRHTLMRQQTRTARHTRNASIPLAVAGVLFSATAGGLFWHTVLASLDPWLNITIGTMFALVVSVTFVQSELLKRIKDDAIREALQSGEMQSTMLRQQSEEMVLEMVVDSMAVTKEDPHTLQEMGATIKGELKTAIRTLTAQTTERLVTAEEVKDDMKVLPSFAEEEEKAPERQKKEPDWVSKMEQSVIPKKYPRLRQKLDSLRSSGRVTISILSLVDTLSCSKKVIQHRIKNGVLQVATHNNNLVRIDSVIDWLQTADLPTVAKESPEHLPQTEEGRESQNEDTAVALPTGNSQDTIPKAQNDKLSIALAMVRQFPDITDEELAAALGLSRPASAGFWKVKAREMIQADIPDNNTASVSAANTTDQVPTKQNGHTRNEGPSLNAFPEILV